MNDIEAAKKAEAKLNRVRRKHGVSSSQFWEAKKELEAAWDKVHARLYS